MEITLEMVDKVIERTGVSYAEAKRALEYAEGNVLDAIIYLEKEEETKEENKYETIDEIKVWLKDLINKGNVTRIKVSKDDKKIVDVPVNAGIAAGVLAIVIPALLAFVVVAAVVTKVTIEITMADGSVQVVNKYITDKVQDIKDAAQDLTEKVKDKVQDMKDDTINVNYTSSENEKKEDNVYTYTVKFDEEEQNKGN